MRETQRWNPWLVSAVAAILLFAALPSSATKYVPGESLAGTLAPAGGVVVAFSDDFDSYATGSQLHGQGGWKGWDNVPAAGALASSTVAHTPPNSAEIAPASDLVHELSGYTSGVWTLSFRVYVPSGSTSQRYFILLNTYADGGPYNWSTQVLFDAGSSQVTFDGALAGALPLAFDSWVPMQVEIDLDNDFQTIYYGGQVLAQGSWADGVSGGGALNLAAVDLYGNGASPVYYDSFALFRAASTQEIPTLGIWGLALLVFALGLAATRYLVRRRAAA